MLGFFKNIFPPYLDIPQSRAEFPSQNHHGKHKENFQKCSCRSADVDTRQDPDTRWRLRHNTKMQTAKNSS